MQFTAPRDFEFVRVVAILNPQCHVVDQLPMQPFAQLAAGDVFAFTSGKGRGIDLEGHTHGRLIDLEWRQRLDGVGIADHIGNTQTINAGEGDDVACRSFGEFDSFQTLKAEDLQHPAIAAVTVFIQDDYRRIGLDLAAADTANANDPDIAVIVQ